MSVEAFPLSFCIKFHFLSVLKLSKSPHEGETCSMPRHPRLRAPGLLFYLMVRGNNKQAIYLDSTDYEEFLAAVEPT